MSTPSAPVSARARSGRRPGDSGTREAIRAAASGLFGELGYERTSVRAIAREAGVDPGLVTHFYGSKQKLFTEVVDLPVEPSVVLPHLLGQGTEGVGRRLAEFVVGLLESEEGRRRITGLVRSAASEPEAANIMRERITRQVLAPLAEGIGADRSELRAAFCGQQIVGLVMARYIVAVEPLASVDPGTVIDVVGSVFQRLLTEPLESG
jgi:AcrR family transcriptional regulator